MALPADTVLYLILPIYGAQFGVTLAEVGMLLAANRIIRIIGYGWVVQFYARHGDRRVCTLAATAAAACALGYGLLGGFWPLLLCRLLWGLSFAGMNLSTQALATSRLDGASRRMGLSRATIALGPMLALPLAALSAQTWSPRVFFLVLALVALAAVPLARRLPAGPRPAPGKRARFTRPGALDVWSFFEGVILDGLFIVGLSVLGQSIAPTAAVLIAGLLLALRYLGEILLSPVGGHAAERYSPERMLVALSLATAVALIGFGAGWVWGGAAAIVVLRSLQLPLVAPIVARRSPEHERVHALAKRAIWRDIGAGTGPLLAGFLLPSVSPLLIYGGAALCLGAAALACRHSWRLEDRTAVTQE